MFFMEMTADRMRKEKVLNRKTALNCSVSLFLDGELELTGAP
jgi:hypothetical protein